MRKAVFSSILSTTLLLSTGTAYAAEGQWQAAGQAEGQFQTAGSHFVMSGAAMAALQAKAGTLPDSPFYFLSEWKNRLQAAFTFNSIAKAQLLLEQADQHLAQAAVLAAKGEAEYSADALRAYGDTLTEAQMILAESKQASDQTAAEAKRAEQQMTADVEGNIVLVASLAEQVPDQAKTDVTAHLATASSLAAQELTPLLSDSTFHVEGAGQAEWHASVPPVDLPQPQPPVFSESQVSQLKAKHYSNIEIAALSTVVKEVNAQPAAIVQAALQTNAVAQVAAEVHAVTPALLAAVGTVLSTVQNVSLPGANLAASGSVHAEATLGN